MSLSTCFQRAAALGILSQGEARDLTKRYNDLIRDGMSNAEARDRMAAQVKAEADHRERAALLTHLAIDRLLYTINTWRDAKGRQDEASALLNVLENMGRDGTFIQDVKGREDAIVRSAMSDMKDVMRELRRGAITGDLRRARKPVRALMDNIAREIMGESTDDVTAKALAKAWTETAEKLRQRFNAAGGAIGKLEGGYIPQSHDALALLAFKRGPWVDYMMEKGRLDRDRMIDQKSGLPLTDSELRTALGVAWDRITTDGYFDADVTAQPQGKGALYTQHMDHRFIHFASADKWMEYNRRFGGAGGDLYAAMMGHIAIMARDIAQMEVLGPNPTRTLDYIKSHLRTKAGKMASNEVVRAEQAAELKRLAALLNRTAPDYQALLDRHAEILRDIDAMRATLDHNTYVLQSPDQPLGPRGQRYQTNYDNAIAELHDVTEQLKAYDSGDKSKVVEAPAVEAEYVHLLEHMRDYVSIATHKRSGDRAQAWVEAKIRRLDGMWELMRGGKVGDPVWGARWQSTRNFISSAALGSAVISSLSDPAFGQDARLRLGMGMKKSNFARIAINNLREIITLGSREDAIAAGLGLDSALRVLHRSAREVSGWDHRFWSSYAADRVLTLGGLTPWTQAGKTWFGMDLMRFAGTLAAQDWSAMPESTRKAFVSHGITAKDWALLRTVEQKDGFLRPAEVIAVDRELGERYLQMIMRETRFAVPEATVRSSSLVHGGPAGTLTGELMRSAMQFKGFGLAVLMLHPMRIARELGAANDWNSAAGAAGYAATLFITSTMLGMFAIALKDMKDGRDPRKWLDEKTWLDPMHIGEAILQAGGLGIFGDFIRASDNRMGGGLAGTMAGPIAGKVDNILTILSPKQFGKWYTGKDVTTPEEIVRFFRSGVVPGSNHWAVAAIYQRALMDRLQRFADPDAQRSFNQTINRRMKDYNQQYWWAPGSTAPRRPPDVTRMWATR